VAAKENENLILFLFCLVKQINFKHSGYLFTQWTPSLLIANLLIYSGAQWHHAYGLLDEVYQICSDFPRLSKCCNKVLTMFGSTFVCDKAGFSAATNMK